MASPVNILLVAADPVVRSSLVQVLDSLEGLQVKMALSPAELPAEAIEDLPADINLAIWDLGWDSGELALLDFHALAFPVIPLAADGDQATDAWRAGARVILGRQLTPKVAAAAVRAALAGLVVLDPSITAPLLPSIPQRPGDLLKEPTPREHEVLQLLAQGHTNRAIAAQLGISEHTVKFHVNSLLTKLQAQSRTEAVIIATRLGYILV